MKQLVMLLVGLLLSGFMATQASYAAKEFPATFADFEKMSFKEMKSLPDVKVDLNKKIEAADLQGKSETELILMKNSIYAQHGFRFSQKTLANYFLGRSWYKPNTETQGIEKLNTVSRANLETFLKQEVAVKSGGRSTADHIGYDESQMAYALFSMGFCTYEVDGDAKAGMIVFDPAGVAHVFHSKASRAALAPYAYEHYLAQETAEVGTLLIQARWSIKKEGRNMFVDLDFADEDLRRYKDENNRPIIAPGTRRLLTRASVVSNMYPFVKTKKCEMVRLK